MRYLMIEAPEPVIVDEIVPSGSGGIGGVSLAGPPPARVVACPDPPWSAAARAAGGRCDVLVDVDAKGAFVAATTVRCVGAQAAEARAWVPTCTFAPAMIGEVPRAGSVWVGWGVK